MILSSQAKQIERLVLDNSPLILTALGVTGTLTTAYLTAKSTFKAAEIIGRQEFDARYDESETNKELNTKEKVDLIWKLYIPPVATAATTITCIIFANRIGTRRAAALAAAYSLSEKAFVEYKEKVLEKIGATKETAVRDEVAQDRVSRTPVNDKTVIITGDGEQLCFDSISGRYFKSTIEDIKAAQNATNYQILNNMFCSLGEFYERIGLPATQFSEEVGWNVDTQLEITFSAVMTEDQKACISLEYQTHPIRGYSRLS